MRYYFYYCGMISYKDLKIGEKIRQIRELKKITREQIASNLKISARAYADIENEEVGITLKRLVEIANIFNCELPEILSFSSNKFFSFYVNDNKGTNINHADVNNVNELTLVETIIKAKDETILHLEKQIVFLQSLIKK